MDIVSAYLRSRRVFNVFQPCRTSVDSIVGTSKKILKYTSLVSKIQRPLCILYIVRRNYFFLCSVLMKKYQLSQVLPQL